MAWSIEHKQKTREKILRSAAQLFTQNGYDNIGIDDVMTDAGLTRGAFYTHFTSKSELYAESILIAAKHARQSILAVASTQNKAQSKAKSKAKSTDAQSLVNAYLSHEHRSGEDSRCPLAFLATDIGQRDECIRDAYTKAFKGFVEDLELDKKPSAYNKKLQRAVLMIGGLAISRALSDKKLITELFTACKEAIMEK